MTHVETKSAAGTEMDDYPPDTEAYADTLDVPPADEAGVSSASGDANSSETVFLELSWGDRWFLAVGGSILLSLMGIYAWRLSSGGRETIEVRHMAGADYQYQLEINSATWVEWMQLDGVGDVLARRIVEDRDTNGPFTSVEDLDRVPGIGPATLERLRPHLTIGPSANPDSP